MKPRAHSREYCCQQGFQGQLFLWWGPQKRQTLGSPTQSPPGRATSRASSCSEPAPRQAVVACAGGASALLCCGRVVGVGRHGVSWGKHVRYRHLLVVEHTAPLLQGEGPQTAAGLSLLLTWTGRALVWEVPERRAGRRFPDVDPAGSPNPQVHWVPFAHVWKGKGISEGGTSHGSCSRATRSSLSVRNGAVEELRRCLQWSLPVGRTPLPDCPALQQPKSPLWTAPRGTR